MLSNDTYLNVLVSFAYVGKSKKFTELVFGASADQRINVMIDSGAFTLHFAKPGKLSWINLDNYCKFLDMYSQYAEKYVNLDVINNDAQSRNNYETMLERGYNPMYVFTSYDTDYEYLKFAVTQNPHICVSGGLLSNRQWIRKRYQDVYKHSGGLLHALGFVKFPDMLQLPLHSVDSSTWIQGAQIYGILKWWDNGIQGIQHREVFNRKRVMPPKLTELLDKYQVSVKDFNEKENHHKQQSIEGLLSTVAYIEYQKYCKARGLNLFLACSTTRQVENIIWVDEQMSNGTLTYDKFKKVGSH